MLIVFEQVLSTGHMCLSAFCCCCCDLSVLDSCTTTVNTIQPRSRIYVNIHVTYKPQANNLCYFNVWLGTCCSFRRVYAFNIFSYLAVAAELRPLGKSMLAVQNKETAIRILRSLNQSKCIASHIRSMYRGWMSPREIGENEPAGHGHQLMKFWCSFI